VLHHWHEAVSSEEVTSKRLIEIATAQVPNSSSSRWPDFREALLNVAGEGGHINSRRLGYWLRSVKGRVVDQMRIEEGKTLHGDNRWRFRFLNSSGGYGGYGGHTLPKDCNFAERTAQT